MKTRKFLWALLSVAAVLLMTACGGDDADDVTPTPTPNPVTPGTENVVKSVPYTVTVNTGNVTRTTVDNDDITLRFEAKDKLYVQNDGGTVYGCLTLKSGAGETTATFAGTVNYTGSTPDASTALTATLVGSGNLLDMIGTDGKVKGDAYISIPATPCETMLEAVSKYSWIRGTGTYGEAVFTLKQRTAFMMFSVTLEDGTSGSTEVPVKITNDSDTYSFSQTTTGSQFDAYISFVLPFEEGKTIDGDASMCVANVGTDDESIRIGTGSDVTLTGGKVYPVTRTKDFVRLWEGGPVWATKNLGASSVTDKGGYYCWGGLVDVTNVTLGWNSNCPFWKSGSATGSRSTFSNIDLKFSRYVPKTSTEYWGGDGDPDNLTTLLPEDDVATQTLGSPWRMPTIDEFDNSTGLGANTTKLGTTVNGALGVIYTGKSDYNKKAIFLPTAGDRVSTGDGTGYAATETYGIYWSSSLKTDQPYCAQDILSSQTTSSSSISLNLRNYGRNVRAVHD